MKNLMQASAYVGTYGKYASGSIAGKWLQLSKYESKNEFLQTCKRLHKDESDPEFMFQDYENVSDSMIGESFISDEIWKVLAVLKKYDANRQEAFAEWCEANGYEQDLQSIKEFSTIKFKKNSLPHEFLLKEEFSKIWVSEHMRSYCLKEVSNCVRTSFGGLVIFEKPKIETNFCFGYHDSMTDTESYDAANDACENFGEKQFLANNLADMQDALNLFEGNKKDSYESTKNLYFARKYSDSNLYSIVFLNEYDAKDKAWRFDGLTKATDEDLQKCYAAQKQEYEKFEKRLKSYLKRYGTKKLQTWTYWADE
ncbi:antirestriction protein ArdA [Prevotella amnii]|uniref:antirestriction protein ArdA n=1 Tax=Prevotella amnii TaxID=419005 RepID=UPI00068D56A5|nr:antirestriction protein ArdA [Prevotella amnii]